MELSRATLEFSFNSPNNISGQNISFSLWKFVWSKRELASEKSLVHKHYFIRLKFGSHIFWVQTNLGPNVGPQKCCVPKICSCLVRKFWVHIFWWKVVFKFFWANKIFGQNNVWWKTFVGQRNIWSKTFEVPKMLD